MFNLTAGHVENGFEVYVANGLPRIVLLLEPGIIPDQFILASSTKLFLVEPIAVARSGVSLVNFLTFWQRSVPAETAQIH